MSFNPGDRVKWRHNEPFAEPAATQGVIEEIVFQYKVKWDSGEVEVVDEDDLVFDYGKEH